MALMVTTTSTSDDLTTVAAVKEALGIVGTSDDVYLGHLITRVSAAIARYCNVQSLMREEYVETIPGYGGFILQVGRTPVRDVFNITLRGESITDFVIEDAYAGWLYREAGWTWTKTVNWSLTDRIVSGGELPLYSVSYEAGLLLASSASSEGRTLPDDLEQAAIEAVKDWRMNRVSNPSILSRTIGPLSVTYSGPTIAAQSVTEGGLPAMTRALLQQYRRSPVLP